LEENARLVENLGRLADQLRTLWKPFPGLRVTIPEFHRQTQGIYDKIDQFGLKVEYLEHPVRSDLTFITQLIDAVQAGIQEKDLLQKNLQKKLARNTPPEYIRRTKQAHHLVQKIFTNSQKILCKCRAITQQLLDSLAPQEG
jgi:hypothetical protein